MRSPNLGNQQLIVLGVVVFVTIIISRIVFQLFPSCLDPTLLIPFDFKNIISSSNNNPTVNEKHVDNCDNLWHYGMELKVKGVPDNWKPFDCEMVNYRNLT
jgi:hypothetical protein